MSFRVKRQAPESGGIPMDPETDDAYFKQPRSAKRPRRPSQFAGPRAAKSGLPSRNRPLQPLRNLGAGGMGFGIGSPVRWIAS